MHGFIKQQIDGNQEYPTYLSVKKDAFLQRNLRSETIKPRGCSFTFLKRLKMPAGVLLCVVLWIRLGIYLVKEVV